MTEFFTYQKILEREETAVFNRAMQRSSEGKVKRGHMEYYLKTPSRNIPYNVHG